MHPQDTINGDSVHISLLEAVSLFSQRANAPGFSGTLPPKVNRQAFPGLQVTQFERKLRSTLNERFHDLLVELSPQMQARSPQLYIHAQKTLSHTARLVHMLDLSEEEQITIALAAFFHDIGKLEIDEALLNKTTPLTPQEFAIIKHHPAYGANILNRLTSPAEVELLVYHHHERWDGEGYPDGLAGGAIPLGARIIAIADAFDAMTSDRSYQERRTSLEALEELQQYAGTQFDPLLVQLFHTSKVIPTHRTSIVRSCPVNH
ncbi:MAG: hypothetical protein NVS3B14_02850 [Ktedonobacteraceae bacterium]